MAAPIRYGSEFQVNTTTSGGEDSASVAALANGKFVVVWEDNATGSNDIRRQIYNADGTKFGGEVIVAGDGNQRPDVVGTADGRFAVTWQDLNGEYATVDGEVFNADGTSPSGTYATAFVVSHSTTAPASGAAIAAAQGGRFLIGYEYDYPTDGDVWARSYNAAGAFSTEDFPIDVSYPASEIQAAVAGLTDGGYIMVWTDSGQTGHTDGSGSHIRMQLMDGTGTRISGGYDPIVNTYTTGDQDQPAVVGLSNGGAVVVYRSFIAAGETGIEYVLLNADGTHQYNSGFGPVPDQALSQPAVAATATGFVVAYVESGNQDGSGTQIAVYSFNNDGSIIQFSKIVAEATITAGDQFEPDIAVLADGRFVVTWTDPGLDASGTDTSGNGVRAQIFDPRTAAVNLVGLSLGDDLVGTGFGDSIVGVAGDDSLNGGGGNDTLGGGDNDDTLKGGADTDKLYGNDGNDRLDGGTGADSLTGGIGNDIFIVDNAADQVIEAAGGGSDTVFASIDYALQAGQSIELLATTSQAGTAAIHLTGNSLGQVLRGNGGDNTLSGGGGADSLYGFGGNDRYIVDSSDDRVTEAAGQGSDTVFASTSYQLANGQSVELLATSSQAGTTQLSLTGNEQAQTIRGNEGINGLYGADGNDTLYGFGGNDRLVGGNGRDVMDGGAGNDVFAYSAVIQSTGVTRDLIQNINLTAADKFQFTVKPTGGIHIAVAHGTLNEGASFDSSLNTAIHDASTLGAHQAVLFTPDGGMLAHHVFLVLDVNGAAGYQAGADYVVELQGVTGTLTTDDFV